MMLVGSKKNRLLICYFFPMKLKSMMKKTIVRICYLSRVNSLVVFEFELLGAVFVKELSVDLL